MTARTRSPSPASGPSKKAKIEKQAQKDIALPVGEVLDQWRGTYDSSTPYRHAVVPGLLTDELLEGVVEESRTYGVRGEEGSLPGWGWEQKETDIYKIQQTPDLASLDPEHLPEETLAALPYLNRLRSALYSSDFRSFVRKVTGCGPLSGKKTDGSVGLYSQGSHLLLHDDSISTRVVSWILYLPNSPTSAPSSSHLRPSTSGKFLKGWDPAWGGGLELFPVESGEETGLPGVKSVHKVPVQWGQIVFFEVQPGRSYHSVEEVIVGDGRQRLGVSGWFHAPVEGEEGYAPVDTEKVKADLSSLAQITSAPTLPLTAYTSDPPTGLSSSHLSFLSQYLAPSYLSASTLEKLCGQFEAASEIVLHNFLNPTIAGKIKDETKGIDIRDYPVKPAIVPQDLGEANGWTIQGPSSKHRYLSLARSGECSTPTLQRILSDLLPSPAFRAWLGVVSSLTPMAHRTEARRFRKGLDYTLANGEAASGEARLDVWLGASWWADVPVASDAEEALLDDGGWECYLASPEEGEDPAVFQSKHAKRVADGEGEGDANGTNGSATSVNGDGAEGSENGQEFELEINQEESDELSPSDFDSDSEDGEEDDGPLLTQAVSFNKLLLVLRDPGVMKFVKYLGAGAGGSRWDVGGEWEVGMLEEESEGEGEGEGEGKE